MFLGEQGEQEEEHAKASEPEFHKIDRGIFIKGPGDLQREAEGFGGEQSARANKPSERKITISMAVFFFLRHLIDKSDEDDGEDQRKHLHADFVQIPFAFRYAGENDDYHCHRDVDDVEDGKPE